MKAIVIRQFGGPEVLRYEDVPMPKPGPGEGVFKVAAVSVNRTLDLIVRAGRSRAGAPAGGGAFRARQGAAGAGGIMRFIEWR
jgi:NADPH:quinone reductase-like Zn-dependent oxidoreductase